MNKFKILTIAFVIAALLCLIIIYSPLLPVSKSDHFWTVISETYLERGQDTPDTLVDRANTFAKSMDKDGRRITMKLLANDQGLFAALIITEQKIQP